ncbi:MAG: hypothetical protein BIFFINMI_02690 [Phycisphaerae bacterium]|nr:hypothetical protein [Phycisphaerae bacterium]
MVRIACCVLMLALAAGLAGCGENIIAVRRPIVFGAADGNMLSEAVVVRELHDTGPVGWMVGPCGGPDHEPVFHITDTAIMSMRSGQTLSQPGYRWVFVPILFPWGVSARQEFHYRVWRAGYVPAEFSDRDFADQRGERGFGVVLIPHVPGGYALDEEVVAAAERTLDHSLKHAWPFGSARKQLLQTMAEQLNAIVSATAANPNPDGASTALSTRASACLTRIHKLGV